MQQANNKQHSSSGKSTGIARSSGRRGRGLSYLATGGTGARYSGGLTVVKNANPSYTMKVPINSVVYSANSTGTLANSTGISAAMVNLFVSRFGEVFREYCIIGADLTLSAVIGGSGAAVAWIEELLASAPTATTANTSNRVSFSLNVGGDTSMCRLAWRLSETEDTGFSDATTTGAIPAFLKIYTDATYYGNTIVSDTVVRLEGTLTIVFRGIR